MFTNLIHHFDRSRLFKSVAWIAGGTALAQAVSMISQPVISRLYVPADFGLLSFFLAVLAVIQPLGTLTYSIAIPIADSDNLALHLVRLCFGITLGMGLVLVAVLAAFGETICRHWAVPGQFIYFWLLPVFFVGAAAYEALSAWALRNKLFQVIARTKISQGISGAGIKIALGLLGIRPLGLLLGNIANNAAGCGSMLWKLLRAEPGFLRGISLAGAASAAGRFARFPLVRLWARLLLAIYPKIPVFFIAARFGLEVVGQFGMAVGMASLPMTLIGQAVSQVYFAEIAQIGRSQPAEIRRIAIAIMKKMFLVGMLPTAVIVATGPWLFSFVFGEPWREAGAYARLICIPVFFRFVASPIASCLDVLEKQSTQFLFTLWGVVAFWLILQTAQIMDLSALHTIAAYAAGLTAHAVLGIVIVLCVLKRQMRAAGACRPEAGSGAGSCRGGNPLDNGGPA